MADRPLEGKVAIVTGAGSPIGIGHAMALGLVRAGARVALTDVNQEWLDQSVTEAREIGGDDCAIDILSDVTDPQSCQDAVDTAIARLGGLHILVNNAGINSRLGGVGINPANFWDNSPEAWSRVVAVNLSGNFYMARAAVVHMLEQGWGRIIGVTTSMDLSGAAMALSPLPPPSRRRCGARVGRHTVRPRRDTKRWSPSWRRNWRAPG